MKGATLSDFEMLKEILDARKLEWGRGAKGYTSTSRDQDDARDVATQPALNPPDEKVPRP